MRILYLGSPEFAVAPLEALLEAGYVVVGVVTQPDRPAGRKRMLTPPPVAQAARRAGLTLIQPHSLRDPQSIAQIAELKPDVGVVAAYGEILRKAVLSIPPLGYLNIHPSLLPRHRGPAPVAGAILAGDRETGVSIMKLDPGMDSGPIVWQERVPLRPDARAGPLTDELFRLGGKLLVDLLPRYAKGEVELQPQDHQQATFTRMLKKTDGAIDWYRSAEEIERCIRAYDPWPGTYTFWNGQRLNILAARVHHGKYFQAAPGAVLRQTDQGVLVMTGDGCLELLVVQPSGKRPMSARDWANGLRNAIHQPPMMFSHQPSERQCTTEEDSA